MNARRRPEGAGAGEWTLDRRARGGTEMTRTMILVVAYNAESTLIPVLERIPAAIMAKVEEIVVFDDASRDRTYEVGDAYRRRAGPANSAVLPHHVYLMIRGQHPARS